METPSVPRGRVIAFHLPQFHPIPENDAWWGKGFTEWTNVTRAQPLFEGHYQPRLPADLGFYDLRLPEALQAQAELARSHGICGFCYHYYWFKGGKRLLERPVEQMLNSGKPDFPFCVCWANENWTRRWDGQQSEVLMPQEHDAESDIAFLHGVLPFFRDKRYIRVNGRPLLVIYRATLFPDLTGTVARWREEMRRHGEGPPYLVAAESFDVSGEAVIRAGFDATCEFPPHGSFECGLPRDKWPRFFAPFSGLLLDYERLVNHFLSRSQPGFRRLKTVTLDWDNTARKKASANIMVNFSLPAYQRWLSGAIGCSEQAAPPEERIVFINAWNEWAEGTYLEPDQLHGHAYLEATRAAIYGEPYSFRPLTWPGKSNADGRASPQRTESTAANRETGLTVGKAASSRLCVVAIAVAGADRDIVEAFVRENLRFLDRLLVLARSTQDRTLQILHSLVDEGLPLTVRTAGDGSWTLDAELNRLMRYAIAEWDPGWVVPLDTDEFIDAPDRPSFNAALSAVGGHHGRMPWINHVPTPFDDSAQAHPLRRIRHRYAYDVPAPDVNPRVWKVAVNCQLLRPYVDRYELGEGAHTLVFRGTQEVCRQPIRTLTGVILRHFPMRRIAGEEVATSVRPEPGLQPLHLEMPASVRDFIDLGRVSPEHTQGTPIIVDPFLPIFELRYEDTQRTVRAAVVPAGGVRGA